MNLRRVGSVFRLGEDAKVFESHIDAFLLSSIDSIVPLYGQAPKRSLERKVLGLLNELGVKVDQKVD